MNDAEFRVQLHAELCRAVDLILFRYNPCLRDEEGCLMREECCLVSPGYVHPPGEKGCIYLGPEGCTTDSLGCKLYLCTKALANLPPHVVETLCRIDEIARLWDLTSAKLRDDDGQ